MGDATYQIGAQVVGVVSTIHITIPGSAPQDLFCGGRGSRFRAEKASQGYFGEGYSGELRRGRGGRPGARLGPRRQLTTAAPGAARRAMRTAPAHG